MKGKKLQVIVDYLKISKDVKRQLQNEYPDGFFDFLIQYPNSNGEIIHALRFETDDKIYMIKIPTSLAKKMHRHSDSVGFNDDEIIDSLEKENQEFYEL